jgi:glycerophosphoryl diester phosphodiesterase
VSTHRKSSPIVIAHRGASGYRPEHTLAAYALAIEQGADFIEPDLVASRDGVLIARHENEIGGTTDVAEHPAFAARRTTKHIDGFDVTGFFTEDFTLKELKTLRAKERIPALRPSNVMHDGAHELATLEEIIALAQRASQRGRVIGLYPETKHPSYFAGLGLPLEAELVRTLHAHGYRGRDAKVFIQSFEVSNLQQLRALTELPLIQLMELDGAPYDLIQRGDARSYLELRQPAELALLANTVNGIGVHKGAIFPRDTEERLQAHTTLIDDAHRAGLLVHAWTFRAENAFLPHEHRRADTSLAAHGDLSAELALYFSLGLDGAFCDHPDLAVAARDALWR